MPARRSLGAGRLARRSFSVGGDFQLTLTLNDFVTLSLYLPFGTATFYREDTPISISQAWPRSLPVFNPLFYQIPPFFSNVLSEKCSSLFLRKRKWKTAKTVKGG